VAERTVVVCDVCGEPAELSITFRVAGRNRVQDVCSNHLQELLRQSHAPRRGRRPSAARPRLTTSAKTNPRARSSSGSSRNAAATGRKRATSPETLEKRRAALAKARKVLAKKRAAAAS